MTLGEAKELRYGHIKFVSTKGELRECKVNGAAKTWKTRPGDVDIPVKYGMYEYETDGTVFCPDCGIPAGDFINAAAEYLDSLC